MATTTTELSTPATASLEETAAETRGGIGLLLGLLTPLAACAVIGAMIDAWAVNVRVAVGLLIVAVAVSLLTWILLNGTNPIHFTAPPTA